MIGETPQPGETPRNEGSPWSFADPDPAWWRGGTDRTATDPPTGQTRHPRRRSPQHQAAAGGTGTLVPPGEVENTRTGEAAEGHAAGTQDVAAELQRTEPAIVERDHDQPDPHRYDPLRPPSGHQPKHTAETVAADEKTPAEAQPAPVQPAPAEPDVMVLPEPNARNRPTVPIERTPVPPVPPVLAPQRHNRNRPTEPLPPLTGSPRTDARLERLENHPFWNADPEATEPPPTERPAHALPRRRPGRVTRQPVGALLALIVLSLVSAFFAWVSAEPFWLSMGHGERGYATTTQCTGSGVGQRCVGRFAAADGGFTVARVTLLGVGPGERVAGTVSPARMVSRDSHRSYLGDTSPLLQLRWLLGFTLVLFCGYAIAGVTGARRLETGRARRGAVLASLAGPLLLLGGFLIAAW
ncbi:hypothetical protein [Paractinoplanes rishiriensis]|uniref:Uncharacterized protein n=1 Tax=Paractinoplanes rishiriensis TaxID=1050105 RepID=A0A919N055_9ACTN|nr:hypothetical protein [Actinoplanes rishiriensis]GIE99185.1 hypothetical protein Ari01nite_66500 [Actinoplanes rishiriensis]